MSPSPRVCKHLLRHRDGGHFFVGQGASSAMYLTYISEVQRSPAEKWPRPFGLRPKIGHAALLVPKALATLAGQALVHLESPNFSPRALPSPFWGSNAAEQ